MNEDSHHETQLDKLRAGLFDIPENLKVKPKDITEDDLNKSASMLTSILEVDLGIKAKVKNIQETEKAIHKKPKSVCIYVFFVDLILDKARKAICTM